MKRVMTVITILLAVSFFAASTASADPTATSTVSGLTASAGITQNNEAADLNDGRAFANPGNPQYGPLINYFGKPLPSSGFQPLEYVLMYECFFTEGSLKSILADSENGLEAEMKVANEYFTPAGADEAGNKWIKVVVSMKPYQGDTEFIGYVTGRSDNGKTTSVEVMAESALAAMKAGANVIHFSSQGAVRDVEAFGWGIGLNTTQASLHGESNGSSNVTSGGFGISGAEAGTRDKPWLQGFALVDHALVYPALPVKEIVVEEEAAK